MKKIFYFLFISFISFFVFTTNASTTEVDSITGFANTNTGDPIPNAVISDGYAVVKTGSDGYYSFPRHDRTEFVFISVPEAYEIPMETMGHLKFMPGFQHRVIFLTILPWFLLLMVVQLTLTML